MVFAGGQKSAGQRNWKLLDEEDFGEPLREAFDTPLLLEAGCFFSFCLSFSPPLALIFLFALLVVSLDFSFFAAVREDAEDWLPCLPSARGRALRFFLLVFFRGAVGSVLEKFCKFVCVRLIVFCVLGKPQAKGWSDLYSPQPMQTIRLD
jgi:hypothetical protein